MQSILVGANFTAAEIQKILGKCIFPKKTIANYKLFYKQSSILILVRKGKANSHYVILCGIFFYIQRGVIISKKLIQI